MVDIGGHTGELKAELLGHVGAKPTITFQSVWPTARQALALLSGLVPASVRMIIQIVLSVGDTISGAGAVPQAPAGGGQPAA